MNTSTSKKATRSRGLLGKLRGGSRSKQARGVDQEQQTDVEAPAIAATEKDSLLEKDKTSSSSKRSGAALWAKLREKKDEIVFAQQHKNDDEQDKNLRKSRHERELKNEFRNLLEFSLLHCLVAIIVYLAIAVLAYSFLFEQWTVIDSIYFATVTFSTCGYGDIVPTTDASRIFTAVFALCGVASLGIALGVLGSNLVEAQTAAMEQASDLSRRQVMNLFDTSKDEQQIQETKTTPWYRSAFLCHVLPMFGLLFLSCWFLGSEAGWDVSETFYTVIVTATTIGYGDFTPETQMGRLFAVPVILLAVGIMAAWLGKVAETIVERRQSEFHKRLKGQELTIEDLEVMDADEDGKVTLAEYLTFMLVSMNKVEQELIDELTEQFDRLDADGTGSLEKEDLILVAKRKLKNSPKRKLELAEYKEKLLRLSNATDGDKRDEQSSSAAFLSVVTSKLRDQR